MRPPYEDVSKLGFGKYFTDYMYEMKYNKEKGWHDAGVKRYDSFSLAPAACVLHYAQEIFEGLKAYIAADGRILMFRPQENAQRMNYSARRLCMPEIPEKVFLEALHDLVLHEKEWIPEGEGNSLYVRPTMIGVEPFLGVKPAQEYIFYIILSPVGPYYKEGFKPVGIYVEDQMVRAAIGGVGNVKTGGNYAASLMGAVKAEEKGFAQVLWLDAKEHKYVEEVGSMNIFFVYGDTLITPALNGSILSGITRKSVITLARDLGYQVKEEAIAIDQALKDIAAGKLTEVFGTGTAAVVSPVGHLYYKEREYVVNDNKVGQLTQKLYNCLVDIQCGRAKDKYSWVYEVGRR